MSLKTLAAGIGARIDASPVLKFLITGGIAASANFFSRFLFRIYFSFEVSIILSLLVGTVISFFLNRAYTFKAFDEKAHIQFLKYLLVTGSYLYLGSVISSALNRCFASFNLGRDAGESCAHLATIAILTFYNYLVIKNFALKKIGAKRPVQASPP